MWAHQDLNLGPSDYESIFLSFPIFSYSFSLFPNLTKHLSVLDFRKYYFSTYFFCILFFTNFVCKLYANF